MNDGIGVAMNLQQAIDEHAQRLLDLGFSVIPIDRSTKSPKIKWADLIETRLPKWESFGDCNLAILTGKENGLIVVDCDSVESYVGWIRFAGDKASPMRVRTRRGLQFYYRHPGEYVKSDSHIKADGFEYDVKGDKSYVISPPSVINAHQYQYAICTGNIEGKLLPVDKLPVFEMSWRPERASASTVSGFSVPVNAEKYIEKIIAISTDDGGEGRNKASYRVAKKLRDSGLTENDSWFILCQWNAMNCKPPLDGKELMQKLRSAYK